MCAKSSKDPVVANFSKFIHPRNPYRKYDFEALAKEFLEFKSYLNTGSSKDPDKPGKFYLNWADRDAVRCLMKCCLKKDFSLDLELPEGCLAPSLALKMNYLLWIEDMVALNEAKRVTGLDIGTGGGIYFCSMAAKRFDWSMVGTETNLSDFEVAQTNVERNNLVDKVKVVHNADKSIIFPSPVFELFHSSLTESGFSFTVCNPPFYEVTEVRREWKKFSDEDPGRDHEMRVTGGEVSFIGKIIDESRNLGDCIDIFSTLVGQKKSLGRLQEHLSKNKEVKHWVVNQFCQGKTMRWCLAWTYKSLVKLKPTAPVSEARHERKLHTPVRFRIEKTLDDVNEWMKPLIESLALEVESMKVSEQEIVVDFKSFEANWRGQRAKRRQAAKLQKEEDDRSDEPESKRARIEEEKDNPEPDLPVEPLVSGKIHVHQAADADLVFDVCYEGGSMGKSAVVELSQFFKNRLSNGFVKEKCKNAPVQ